MAQAIGADPALKNKPGARLNREINRQKPLFQRKINDLGSVANPVRVSIESRDNAHKQFLKTEKRIKFVYYSRVKKRKKLLR
ncbi:MAG: hypothetical protein AAF998_11525 [Bacteroidota bacterium]